ncbi:glycosyltransferase family 4 protein [Algoriphagus litoralis]|uniref:glycosyltransferase family 4 protein n=1 Tax=Algoriphagus litoralis TaxID=2202829 RepID=UPI000DB99AB7|nr:glycosyltransferase family 4 protein [Algoriphagus litoralis]
MEARILILDTSPIRRGAQIFAEELAESLILKGCQVKRLYLFLPKESVTVSLQTTDSVLPFSERSLLEKFPTFQSGIIVELKKEIDSFKPQIILCNGSKTLKYGAWLRIFGMANKAKLIARFIDDALFWNKGGIKKWAYFNWIERFDGLIAVSKKSLDSVISHYKFQKPATFIHRVFDPKKFANAPSREEARKLLGIAEQDEVLLFLGNLTSQKRPNRFIEIVSQLSQSRPNLKALIVGDGPMKKDLEYQVSSLKRRENESGAHGFEKSNVLYLMSCIFFAGYQQDVSPYLASADLLILTSDTEGLPGVVLEAAHFGVPTVATEVGGIRECLIDGQTGFLIPDRSVVQFCEKINFLLDHPDQRKTMGAKAKAFVADKFQMDKVANQYLDFFRLILSQP